MWDQTQYVGLDWAIVSSLQHINLFLSVVCSCVCVEGLWKLHLWFTTCLLGRIFFILFWNAQVPLVTSLERLKAQVIVLLYNRTSRYSRWCLLWQLQNHIHKMNCPCDLVAPTAVIYLVTKIKASLLMRLTHFCPHLMCHCRTLYHIKKRRGSVIDIRQLKLHHLESSEGKLTT